MATRQAPAVGWRGLFLLVVGAALVVTANRYLDWYQLKGGADSASDTTFDNLRASVDQFGGGVRASQIYFDWLSWTLLIAAIALGALANVQTRLTPLMRILGFVVGASGAGATYYALLQYSEAQAAAGATKHNPFYNASWGLVAVLAGFALAAVGAVLGPRSDR